MTVLTSLQKALTLKPIEGNHHHHKRGSSQSQRSTCTSSTVSSLAFSVVSVTNDNTANDSTSNHNPEKSCLRVRTQALSLERSYGIDKDTDTDDSRFLGEQKNHVTLTTIQMHHHEVMLGDHPSVSSGPPLTIDWNPFESFTLDLDNYEMCHRQHRAKDSILIPAVVREACLRDRYARSELVKTIATVRKLKEDRRRSASDGKLWRRLLSMTGQFNCNKKSNGQ
jgi:hypothetical protein